MAERLEDEYGKEMVLVLLAITENPYFSTNQIAELTGKGVRTVERYISKLKKEGVIERVGPNLGGKWIVK